jgi:hypothetical protein
VLDVGAGEAFDGLAGVPEAQGYDLGAVAVDPRHRPGASVAGRALVLAAARVLYVGDVLLDMLGADDAAPDPGDHDAS